MQPFADHIYGQLLTMIIHVLNGYLSAITQECRQINPTFRVLLKLPTS